MIPDPSTPIPDLPLEPQKFRAVSGLPLWIKQECAKRPAKFRTAFILVNADQALKTLNRQSRRDLARQARGSSK